MTPLPALLILVLLLFGPIAIKSIEHNLELYVLILGILATMLGPGFSAHLVHEALSEPIAISLAVIVAGLVFSWTRQPLDSSFSRLRERMPRAVLTAIAVFVIATIASLITAIIAALLLVEVVGLLRIEPEKRVRVIVAGCFAVGLGASLTPLGEPLSTLAARALNLNFLGLFDLLAPWVFPGVIATSIVAGLFARGDYDNSN